MPKWLSGRLWRGPPEARWLHRENGTLKQLQTIASMW